MKILVADDDRLTRTLLKGILSKLGHEIIEAEDGFEAWRLFKEQGVRLVVSDWVMPGMQGDELCRRIREEPSPGGYNYVILITRKDDRESFTRGMAAGADDFLTKPIDVALLAARIRVAERILSLQRQVGELTGLLPICIYCRTIRTDGEAWERIEAYLASHTDIELSDSVCRDCYQKHLASEVAELDAD